MVIFKMPGSSLAKALGLKYRNFAVFANDLVEVTALAARIRGFRSINVYKGKGIFKKYYRYKKKISLRK
jgi:ribosomal protein L6P/L9E